MDEMNTKKKSAIQSMGEMIADMAERAYEAEKKADDEGENMLFWYRQCEDEKMKNAKLRAELAETKKKLAEAEEQLEGVHAMIERLQASGR